MCNASVQMNKFDNKQGHLLVFLIVCEANEREMVASESFGNGK